MEFYKKNEIVILRILGVVMLLVGFAIHFWTVPQEGLTPNQIAAANVARVEAKVLQSSASSKQSSKKDDLKFLKEFKNTREKQMQYLTIFAMIFGVGFLGYSFLPRKEE